MLPIAYTLTGIALLFLCGFWVAELLFEERRPEFFAAVPIFGLVVVVLWISNLNYLGVPAKFSTIAIALGSLIADVALLRRRRIEASPHWPTWVIIGGSTLLFVLPDAIYKGFPAFNDAVYYTALGDFVRDRSYFASTEPAHTLPWLSQMLVARTHGTRMGAQYFLAALSYLTGTDSFSTFLPATACGLFCSLCGFCLLARAFLRGAWAPVAALAIYGTNIAFVQEPASLNWLSQTVGFGPMFALIAFGLSMHTLSWRSLLTGALLLSGLVSIYPEVLPIVGVPVLIFGLLLLVQRQQSLSRMILFWTGVIVFAVLLNPYTWFYTLHSVLIEFHATSAGFEFMHISRWPVDLYFGLVSSLGYTNSVLAVGARIAGGVLLCLALAGWLALERNNRIIVAGSGIIYAVVAWQQLYSHHFVYAFLKIVVYSYYLVPLCAASGVALLFTRPSWSAARIGGTASIPIWALFTAITAYRFIVTCYFWMPSPRAPDSLTPAQNISALTDLKQVSLIPKPGERTLILCPPDSLDRWVPYFFRRPVGDLFRSEYYSILNDQPVTHAEAFSYYLTLRSQTSWKDESTVTFQNSLFSFSRAQTAMITTNEGWYGAESSSGGYSQWMSKRSRTVVVAPGPDLISIESHVDLAPDQKPKHLHVSMNGNPAGDFDISRSPVNLVIKDLSIRPGLNDLVLETQEAGQRYGADPRLLGLRFERLRIQSFPPASLNMLRPYEAGFVEGLTVDRWITRTGVQVRFRRPKNRVPEVELSGEAFSASVPGAIQVSTEGGAVIRIPILKAGPFTGSAAIRGVSKATDLILKINVEHTFRPLESNASTDSRELGFRLSSIRLKEE